MTSISHNDFERSCLTVSDSNMASKNDFNFCNIGIDEEWPSTLPTPPRSPDSHQVPSKDEEESELLKDTDIAELLGSEDALALIEEMNLDLELGDELNLPAWSSLLSNPCSSQVDSPQSELRHDCMWSGSCDDSCKSRVRYNSEGSDMQLLPLTPASSPPRSDSEQLKSDMNCSEIESTFVDPSAVLNYTPLSDHCYYQAKCSLSSSTSGATSSTCDSILSDLSITETTTSTSSNPSPITVVTSSANSKKALWKSEQYVLSDTPSESDDSDDSDSNEEDEEEIDVVSVSHSAPQHQQQQPALRAHQRSLSSQTSSSQRSTLLKSKSSSKSAHKKSSRSNSSPSMSTSPLCSSSSSSSTSSHTAMSISVSSQSSTPLSAPATPYLLTPVHSPQPSPSPSAPIEYPMPKVTSSGRIVQPTNRSASFLEVQPGSNRNEHHSRKRKRTDNHSSRHAKGSRHTSSAATRVTSADIEDPEKRREHNSMERKRRDDLRFAFQKLRELVPEVKDNSKAAKVIILAKAAEYSRRLQVQQQQLESQLKVEASRRRQLERKLSALACSTGVTLPSANSVSSNCVSPTSV